MPFHAGFALAPRGCIRSARPGTDRFIERGRLLLLRGSGVSNHLFALSRLKSVTNVRSNIVAEWASSGCIQEKRSHPGEPIARASFVMRESWPLSQEVDRPRERNVRSPRGIHLGLRYDATDERARGYGARPTIIFSTQILTPGKQAPQDLTHDGVANVRHIMGCPPYLVAFSAQGQCLYLLAGC